MSTAARRTGAGKPAKSKPAAKKAAAPIAEKPKTAAQKLDAIGVEAICDDITSGKSLAAIARSAGVDPADMVRWRLADPQRSARVREARAAAAETFDDLADRGIEEARDPFELAKAKERAHHLRWRASKVNPKDYGDRMAVDSTVTIRDVSDEELAARALKLSTLVSAA